MTAKPVSPDDMPTSGRRWGWAERMLARIEELDTEAEWLAAHHAGADDFADVKARVDLYLGRAREALWHPPTRQRISGAAIDKALSNYNAATCLLLRHMPDAELRGHIHELAATVTKSLPPGGSAPPRRREAA